MEGIGRLYFISLSPAAVSIILMAIYWKEISIIVSLRSSLPDQSESLLRCGTNTYDTKRLRFGPFSIPWGHDHATNRLVRSQLFA